VHGWTGRATHPNSDGTNATLGNFSHPIDLTANRVGKAAVPRSLVGQLQGIPGAAVFTFDYHPYSGRWVTDPHLGPALGEVIDCLAATSATKVIVIGHSMGGLAARYAAANPDRSTKIRRIITLGTPNTGSIAAMLAASGVDVGSKLYKPIALLRLLLSACGQETTGSMDGGLCDLLPAQVAAFDGEAGKALRYGSPELAALRKIPSSIPVNALAGESTFDVLLGWFTSDKAPIRAGDIVVTLDSAQAQSDARRVVSCKYQLNPVRGVGDTLSLWIGVTAKNDVPQQPVASLFGACFHSNLMRSIELSNEIMGIVDDDVTMTGRSSPVTDPDAWIGTWSGPVDQPGSQPYTTVVTLRRAADGLVGDVAYPELRCRGTLRQSGPIDSDGTLKLTETITDQDGRCVTTVHITLRASGPTTAEASYDAGSATADLSKR
jgi:pimeloyl-ACP methyl ester carboxylesterase